MIVFAIVDSTGCRVSEVIRKSNLVRALVAKRTRFCRIVVLDPLPTSTTDPFTSVNPYLLESPSSAGPPTPGVDRLLTM